MWQTGLGDKHHRQDLGTWNNWATTHSHSAQGQAQLRALTCVIYRTWQVRFSKHLQIIYTLLLNEKFSFFPWMSSVDAVCLDFLIFRLRFGNLPCALGQTFRRGKSLKLRRHLDRSFSLLPMKDYHILWALWDLTASSSTTPHPQTCPTEKLEKKKHMTSLDFQNMY